MNTIPAVAPGRPTIRWRAILRGMKYLPQASLSRAFGRLADVPIPGPLRPPLLRTVAGWLGIDLSEAARPLAEYGTVNQLFVRQLRPGIRNWPQDPNEAASPVDGIIGQSGRVERSQVLQAKGRFYSPAELLDDAEQAKRYEDGSFLTLYLSPRHYHRIHAPTPGTISLARHVPGALLPVNQAAVLHIDRLFAHNERLICYVDGALGRIAVVAVGAYNVGRISAAFDAQWTGTRGVTNRRGARPETHFYDPPRPVARSSEIMAFHLGSTVVLLFESTVRLEVLTAGAEIQVGQTIARRAH